MASISNALCKIHVKVSRSNTAFYARIFVDLRRKYTLHSHRDYCTVIEINTKYRSNNKRQKLSDKKNPPDYP